MVSKSASLYDYVLIKTFLSQNHQLVLLTFPLFLYMCLGIFMYPLELLKNLITQTLSIQNFLLAKYDNIFPIKLRLEGKFDKVPGTRVLAVNMAAVT